MLSDSSESESNYSDIYEELEWQWPTYDFLMDGDDDLNTLYLDFL